MGRPSVLSEKKQTEVLHRLAAGETERALAKEYKVSPSTIHSISKQSEQVKAVAKQIVATNEALSTLTISEQVSAQNYAQKLMAISSNLTDAGIASSRNAKRHAEAAERFASKAKGDDLMGDASLATQMRAASVANTHAKTGIDIMNIAAKTGAGAEVPQEKDITPDLTRIRAAIALMHGS